MKGIKIFAVPLVLSLSLTGCFLDSDSEPASTPVLPPVVNATVQVVHAAIDAPDVKVSIDNEQVISELEFADASDVLSVPPNTYNAKVDAILPGENNTSTVLGPIALSLAEATRYTVFAVGKVADESLETLVVSGSVAAVPANKIRLQVVHAAAKAPEVSVHVTAPNADLATPTTTFAFKDFTAPLVLDPAIYRVRITLPDNETIVFDSGSLELTTAGADLVIAAIDSRFSGPSPVSLLAIDQEGGANDILDVKATSSLRVVHNVSDAPAVDVIVNDSITLVDALSFPDFTDYVAVTADTYNVKVAADADNSVVVIDADVTVEAGKFYTVLAIGSLNVADDVAIEPLILSDEQRRIATEAQVRIVHGSTLAGNVDIYVTANGDIAQASPAFSNVPYKADTGYVSLAEGYYVVTVTPAGEKGVAIEAAVNLTANKIYTAIARDGLNLDSTMLGLILMDDFVAIE